MSVLSEKPGRRRIVRRCAVAARLVGSWLRSLWDAPDPRLPELVEQHCRDAALITR